VTVKKKLRDRIAASPALDPGRTSQFTGMELISGPKLRAKFGISAVTLWRWRHNKENGFPAPKVIHGRLYFPSDAVAAWLARQDEAV
jgi:predicted DNA-binding transcriptional regulator AlpA